MPLSKIEYRVRPVQRYVVTRYHEQADNTGQVCGAGCETRGEFTNEEQANSVAYALCKLEHIQQGWPPGDERILYPEGAQFDEGAASDVSDRVITVYDSGDGDGCSVEWDQVTGAVRVLPNGEWLRPDSCTHGVVSAPSIEAEDEVTA